MIVGSRQTKIALKSSVLFITFPICLFKLQGNRMVKRLSEEKIACTLIADAAIFSMMSRVSKVIIGAQTVLSNGGFKAFVGATLLATTAKFHSVPVSRLKLTLLLTT